MAAKLSSNAGVAGAMREKSSMFPEEVKWATSYFRIRGLARRGCPFELAIRPVWEGEVLLDSAILALERGVIVIRAPIGCSQSVGPTDNI